MNIKVNQDNTRTESNVSDNTVEKIYQELKDKETHNQQDLVGRVEIEHGYEDTVEFLNTNYRNFRCITTGEPYIRFVDPEVEIALKDIIDHMNDYTYDGVGLTQIDLDQFKRSYDFDRITGNTKITKFPEFNRLRNYTNVLGSCFNNCSNLEEINFSNITTISGSWCFHNTGLKNINLPNCVSFSTATGGFFADCPNLITFNAPLLETFQSGSIFQSCNNLTTVYIPNAHPTKVMQNTFYNCKSLVNLTLDMSNVTELQGSAFENCYNLPPFDISSIIIFGKASLKECHQFVNIEIDSCETIYQMTFQNCINLETVRNTVNVTHIDDTAFKGCLKLTLFEDFSSVEYIGSQVFNETLLAGQIDLSSCEYIGQKAFSGLTGLTSVINTGSITRLRTYAFSNCTNLTSIGDLSGVTDIDSEGLFYNCINLTGEINLSNINIQNGDANQYPTIYRTFNNCQKITRVILGNVRSIGYRWNTFDNGRITFYNCIKLHTVDIKHLDYFTPCEGAFRNTPSMKYFILRQTTPPLYTDDYTKDDIIDLTGFGGSSVQKIFVPDEAVNTYKVEWSNIASYIYPLSEYVPIVDE